MGDLDAFGDAGRAGGEEHVGEAIAARGAGRRLGGVGEGQRFGVEPPRPGRQPAVVTGAGQHRRRPRQLQQLPLALGRVGGDDRDVGRARPDHADEGADRLPGAWQADSHHLLIADPGRAQPRRDVGRGGVELGVGEPPLAVLDRDRAGLLGGAGGDELGQRASRLERRGYGRSFRRAHRVGSTSRELAPDGEPTPVLAS